MKVTWLERKAMILVNFVEADVMLNCFLFDGAKILLIFDLIIIIACYYIHKIKRN